MRSDAHLKFVRSLGCIICEAPAEAAHVNYADAAWDKPKTGMGGKAGDEWTVPLCAQHHRLHESAQHKGNERAFWARHGIDPLQMADHIFSNTGDVEAATLFFPAPIKPVYQQEY